MWRALIALTALFTLIVFVLPTAGALSTSQNNSQGLAPRTVVVVGTANLTWADLLQAQSSSDPEVNLAALGILQTAGEGYPVSLVTRTTRSLTCPADGWLTLGAGQRVNGSADDGNCDTSLTWESAQHFAHTQHYQATVGSLASTVITEHGAHVITVGPHAWLAGNNSASSTNVDSIDEAFRERTAVSNTPALILIDATPSSCSDKGSCFNHSDEVIVKTWQAISQVTNEFSEYSPMLVVASLSDSGRLSPQLGIFSPAFAHTQTSLIPVGSTDFVGPGTHQKGLVQTRSLSSLITDTFAAPELPAPRSLPVLSCGSSESSSCESLILGRDAAERLQDEDLHAQASRLVTLPIAIALIIGILITTTISACLLRGNYPQTRALAFTASTSAGFPLLLTLGNSVPWWRLGARPNAPAPWLPATIILGILIVSALIATMLVTGIARLSMDEPRAWRTVVLALAATASAVVFIVPAVNQRFALNGLLGMNTIIAGRFFGVSNPAFAVASAGLVIALTMWALAAPPSSRWVHALGIGIVGAVAMSFDAAPSVGADVGGALALGIIVLLVMMQTLRWRLTIRRFLIVTLSAFTLVTAFALYDATRAVDSQTHAGHFITNLSNGQSLATLTRKVRALVGPLIDYSWIGPLILLVVVVIGVHLWQKTHTILALSQQKQGPYPRLALAPHGRTYLTNCFIMLVIEVALNDSGLLMVGYALSMMVPLLLLVLTSSLMDKRTASSCLDVLKEHQ